VAGSAGSVSGSHNGGTSAEMAGAGNEAAGSPGGARGQGGEQTAEGGAPASNEPVELAKGKPAIASSEEVANVVSAGNDGLTTTRWCANVAALPQWWRVDLGSTHTLSSFAVQWEHADRAYSYQIDTSLDDLTYVGRVTTSGTGAVLTGIFPVDTQARYVKVTLTSALPSGWASFYELSILGL
jgi:F5/8 type C domain